MRGDTRRNAERLTPGLAYLVLAVAYLVLAALYAWQASKRVSPTIFSDEIDFTQISRAIAEDGVPSRRGEESGFGTLYTYVVAPAWWIDDIERAWELAKLIGVLVMTSAIFPAYGLARFVVSRPWALGAAIASVAAPPLAYAPYLLDEPLAYPISTAALWAITAATAQPTPRRLVVAAALCAVAPLVRGQLAVLFVVFAACLLALLWWTDRFARWRATWTAGDWLGLVLLVSGAAVVASAAAGHRWEPWYRSTGFLKQRMLDHGAWSLAAMAIGLGILPLVATVAVFFSRRVRATREGRAFVTAGAAAFVGFVWYAAIKGAYLSTEFSTLIVERNVIYLVPVALAATAAVLAQPVASIPAIAAGLAVSLFLVVNAEFRLDQYPYFEAPSLAITALTNRNFAWDHIDVEHGLLVAAFASAAILVARSRLRAGAVALGVAVVAGGAVAAWGLTTEVYAARGLNTFAERLHGSTPRPVDWVDRTTGGEPALYLGQQIKDHNQVWLLEFWNRSVERIWSLDGSADAPSLSPNLAAPDGTINPDPEVEWVVAGNGVEVVGEQVGTQWNAALYRVPGPVRLRQARVGVYDDGWMGERASYSRYAPDEVSGRGFARVVLSREGACGATIPTATAVVRIGNVVVRDQQPGLGSVRETARRSVEPCSRKTVVLRAVVPFHIEVTVSPTFIPAEIDANSGDTRPLGVQVGFDFIPLP